MVQLTGRPQGSDPVDTAQAVRAGASALGHRPAVTVLHAFARYEQSGASLANWAAKGAHLLELDHLIGPGSRVGLLAPPCWTTASVALASWWLGAAVVLDAPGEVTVVNGDTPAQHDTSAAPPPRWPDADPMLVVGDGLDGAPLGADAQPAWTRQAQPLPDHPPVAQAGADLLALVVGERHWTQGELLALVRDLGHGTAGVDAAETEPAIALAATALRPLVTGEPTVVLRGVDRAAAAQERVSVWL